MGSRSSQLRLKVRAKKRRTESDGANKKMGQEIQHRKGLEAEMVGDERCLSGIDGLDNILAGGFPRGGFYLWRDGMPVGTVKWFNPTKGYGFIQPDDGGNDVFVHVSAVERAGLNQLNDGQTVSYEVAVDRRTGKSSADRLQAM